MKRWWRRVPWAQVGRGVGGLDGTRGEAAAAHCRLASMGGPVLQRPPTAAASCKTRRQCTRAPHLHCLGLNPAAPCLTASQSSLRARCAACPAPSPLCRRSPAPLLACCCASRLQRQPAKVACFTSPAPSGGKQQQRYSYRWFPGLRLATLCEVVTCRQVASSTAKAAWAFTGSVVIATWLGLSLS